MTERVTFTDERGQTREVDVVASRPSGSTMRCSDGEWPGVQYLVRWTDDGRPQERWTVTFPDRGAPPCPCSTRTVEDQWGRVVWRATDAGEWCGNPAEPFQTAGGQTRLDGHCEACVVKACEWCHHD